MQIWPFHATTYHCCLAPPLALRIPEVILRPPSTFLVSSMASPFQISHPQAPSTWGPLRTEMWGFKAAWKGRPKTLCPDSQDQITGASGDRTAFATGEFNEPRELVNFQWTLSKAVTCSPLTVLMGLVPSCPCRGAFTLLSLLTAHSKTNLPGSQTQDAASRYRCVQSFLVQGSDAPEDPCPTGGQQGSSSFPLGPNLALPLEAIRDFNLSISQTPTLCSCSWPGMEMRVGDSEMARCTSVRWVLSMSPRREGLMVRKQNPHRMAGEWGTHKQLSICCWKIEMFTETAKEQSKLAGEVTRWISFLRENSCFKEFRQVCFPFVFFFFFSV